MNQDNTTCFLNQYIHVRGLFKKYQTFAREKYIYTPGGLQPHSPPK